MAEVFENNSANANSSASSTSNTSKPLLDSQSVHKDEVKPLIYLMNYDLTQHNLTNKTSDVKFKFLCIY